MIINGKYFQPEGRTYVCGILNVTPDSFSDGGKWNTLDKALQHTEEMIKQGADLIDIGGESTRPGYTRISDEEEIQRVVPVIEEIRKHFDIPVSIDTYKSAVAKAALKAGAGMVNDIWGLKADTAMAELIAETGVSCCIMHNRDNTDYKAYPQDVIADLKESLEIAQKAGIKKENITIDPGIGFGKTYEQNLILMNRLEILHELGYPIYLGTSRKSMIGLTLDLPKDKRDEGTLVTTVMAVEKHCMFVRVHNVEANVRAVRMAEAILRA